MPNDIFSLEKIYIRFYYKLDAIELERVSEVKDLFDCILPFDRNIGLVDSKGNSKHVVF